MCINVVIHLPPKLTPKSTYVITQLNRYFVGSPRQLGMLKIYARYTTSYQ